MDSLKILNIANKIARFEYSTGQWRDILDKIAELFEVDGAFIGLWDEGYINFKHSSYLLKKNLPESQFPDLYRVPLKQRKKFKEEIEKKGFILIEDYPNYPYALKSWLEAGLKSLLAAIIKSKKVYGSLHLISFKKRKFNKTEIDSLRVLTNFIASEMDKQNYIEQIRSEQQKNALYIDFLKYLKKQPVRYDIKSWIIETLKKIKELTLASEIAFLFSSEDMYVKLNKNIVYSNLLNSQDSLVYKVWQTNTKNVSTVCLNKTKTAILIPVLSGDITIAVFSLIFDSKLNLPETDLEVIQTLLTHFVSLIHTYKNIRVIADKLSETERGLLEAFISAMEARDVYTKGHSEHVANYARIIAKKLNLDVAQQEMIYNAGLLHDIGKISIPDFILLKPGRLTPFEYEIMKYHPIISYEMVRKMPKFSKLANCIRHHHERMDGSGYPDGLTGDKIELGARILAIADIFDALTTDRPYRKGMNPDDAIEILKNEQVDQEILCSAIDDLKANFNKGIPQSQFVPPQLEKLRKEFIETDLMTGTKNRNYLIKKTEEFIFNKKQFALFMIDIKNMAYINYKYGREAGDRIILFVAEELKKLNNIEALSRTTADAFMFIYSHDDIEQFKSLLQKH